MNQGGLEYGYTQPPSQSGKLAMGLVMGIWPTSASGIKSGIWANWVFLFCGVPSKVSEGLEHRVSRAVSSFVLCANCQSAWLWGLEKARPKSPALLVRDATQHDTTRVVAVGRYLFYCTGG